MGGMTNLPPVQQTPTPTPAPNPAQTQVPTGNPLDFIPRLVPQAMNSVQQAPWAPNPYAGFTNQPMPSEGQRLGGMTPEDWVYLQMMSGMGSQVPGMQTNQLVPGSNAPSQYTPNPYIDTLGSIVPQIPLTGGGGTTPPPVVTPEAWLAYDLNKDGKLGKKERKAFQTADLAGYQSWGGNTVPGSVPGSVPTAPINLYDYRYLFGN